MLEEVLMLLDMKWKSFPPGKIGGECRRNRLHNMTGGLVACRMSALNVALWMWLS